MADPSDAEQQLWIIGNKTIGDRKVPRKDDDRYYTCSSR